MSRLKRVHVIGAGLAGLAAAVRLADAGVRVVLHEAARQAGGRCRSYDDATLGCRIDNGNHLLIAGNHGAMAYLSQIGARETLVGQDEAAYPFIDLTTGERWTVRPNQGRVPWWLLQPARRVAGTNVADYAGALRLMRARPEHVVTDMLDRDTTIFQRLWQPLAVAALNTEVERGSARLLARVLRESFGAGGDACRPLVPRAGLSESLVDPALAYLARHGAELRFGDRLRGIDVGEDAVSALSFDAGSETVASEEAAVLAVTAPVAARLVPNLLAPDEFRGIVNAHFRTATPATTPLFIGVIGGTVEWVFRKREVLSVTISAADRLMDMSAGDLAALLWPEVRRAYDLPEMRLPPWQVVKERRATFAATPAQLARRPRGATPWANLVLAGDWTDTGLPATIEGAIRSGFAAAERLRR